MAPARPRFALIAPGPALVLLAAFALQLPIALMAGYFSHDELQWAWRAETLRFVPWIDDGSTFQHRPLTFNLWMVLSRALFDAPIAFHAVMVLWGSANAALLCAVGRRFGMSPWTAALGALAFVLTPYAAYTHGWVATIADLIWVSCALVLAWCVLKLERPVVIGALAFAIGLIGMSGKEAAAAIPVLCAVAWVFDAARRTRWFAATIGSGLAIAGFIAWRLPALLHAPRDGGAQYVPSLANAPMRWFEYQVFPPLMPLFEAHTTLARPKLFAIAAVLWLGLFGAMWLARRRLALVFLFGGAAALAPVLVLGSSANHYAYGFAALGAMCAAAAWPRTTHLGRVAIATFALLTFLHAAVVMLTLREVARVQSVFSPALAQTLASREGIVKLRVAADAREWIFLRLTHDIPAYRGVPIGERVQIVDDDADFEIRADGSLQPLR